MRLAYCRNVDARGATIAIRTMVYGYGGGVLGNEMAADPQVAISNFVFHGWLQTPGSRTQMTLFVAFDRY